ncbi:protein FAM83B-like [Alosa sapidissima]|uniref:protein FAM83B-like n=1 Tax=Alosa sapidissima TaxID=34773 RepID=UPI001C08BEE2|nr:protein FAM83B-like [Alosa sapidissima]
MESELSAMSSMSEQLNLQDAAPGVYKEAYRLALYALLNGGQEAYQEFLKAEGISDFLSEQEIRYILENKKWPSGDDDEEDCEGMDNAPSTYCPMESDVEVPDLDLGWPEARLDHVETNVHMLFHPPRQNMPSIKTLVRKYIKEAKMVIAIAMDIFTDVDIFRDLVEISTRGVVIYLLLDDLQFNSFLRMSERANVPLQKLWNVRIRTVKGHEYRCQSGAKFHGAMEQKFMLVDCHTVLYGSYSFMWSYEKINLSMVLLITGKLVSCYDEEFRRLFARSIIPAQLQQTTSSTDLFCGRNQGPMQSLHSAKFFERTRSFDTSQLKEMRGRLNMLNHNDKPEEGAQANGANINHGLNLQRNPATNTYSGFQQRMYSSLRQRSRVIGDKGPDVLDRSPFSATGQLNNPAQYRQPGQDDSALHGKPSFLSVSELSLHKWRIDSYLRNDQVPADSTESLDRMSLHSDTLKSSLQTTHSSRSNLIFKIPEQPTVTDLRALSPTLGRRTITSVYTSLQRAKENELGRDSKKPELNTERRLSEDSTTPLTRQTQRPGLVSPWTVITQPGTFDQPSLLETSHQSRPDIKQETEAANSKPILPTPSSVKSLDSLITNTNEEVAEAVKDETNAMQKLSESHRSVSHYDIKTTDDKKTPQSYDWQEPPSRTASATHLGKETESSLPKGSNLKRLRPFSDSNQTRLSLIEIPEEKEGLGSTRNLDEISPSKDADNLTTPTKTQPAPIEANVHISDRRPSITGTITSPTPSCNRDWFSPITSPASSRPTTPTWSSSQRPEGQKAVAASPRTLSALDVVGRPHHSVYHGSQSSVATVESIMSNPGEGRYGIPEVKRNKVYSRFEHFLSVERRVPDKTETDHMNAYAAEKRRSLFMGTSSTYSRYQTQPQTDNRFGKFIQRVGSLIHKNK